MTRRRFSALFILCILAVIPAFSAISAGRSRAVMVQAEFLEGWNEHFAR